jgi:hypothetical protein
MFFEGVYTDVLVQVQLPVAEPKQLQGEQPLQSASHPLTVPPPLQVMVHVTVTSPNALFAGSSGSVTTPPEYLDVFTLVISIDVVEVPPDKGLASFGKAFFSVVKSTTFSSCSHFSLSSAVWPPPHHPGGVQVGEGSTAEATIQANAARSIRNSRDIIMMQITLLFSWQCQSVSFLSFCKFLAFASFWREVEVALLSFFSLLSDSIYPERSHGEPKIPSSQK